MRADEPTCWFKFQQTVAGRMDKTPKAFPFMPNSRKRQRRFMILAVRVHVLVELLAHG
jgi:hypothetical protein